MKTCIFSHTLYIVILSLVFGPFPALAATVIPNAAVLTKDATWTPENSPYIVSNLWVGASTTLSIEPGTVVKIMPNSNFYVLGSLYIGDASTTKDTYFTSIADSSVGGDTSAYLASSTDLNPNAERWASIGFLGGTSDLHKVDFRFGGSGGNDLGELEVDGGAVFVSDSNFENTNGIGSFFLQIIGTLSLERDQFDGARIFAHIVNYSSPDGYATLSVHGSSIKNLGQFISYGSGNFVVDATNNWWDTPLGPKDPLNNPGGVLPLDYSMPFAPWLPSDPFATSAPLPEPATSSPATTTIPVDEVAQGNSNVLFLPGTLESRLYMRDANGKEKRLWEPTSDSEIPSLAMNIDGTSVNEIYTRDIIDQLYSDSPTLSFAIKLAIGNKAILYKTFENFMDSLVSDGVINKWIAFPYDWRYDVSESPLRTELVGQPTGAITKINLQDVLQELASSSPTKKVTIIAHSEGGLVAKALAIELQKENKLQLIDKIILVGVPSYGTPESIGVLLHGDGQTHGLGLITYSGTVRAASKTMPGVYDLLPSSKYFPQVNSPVINFQSQFLKKYVDALGQTIRSLVGLRDFLIDTPGGRKEAEEHDLKTPATLLSSILARSQVTHDELDEWVPPANLKIISIVGWGQNTVSGYTYSSPGMSSTCEPWDFSGDCGNYTIFNRTASLTPDGDGMAVSPSAADSSGETLYFDTKKYGKDSGVSIDHQSLLSALPIENELKTILSNSTSTVVEPYVSKFEPTSEAGPLLVVSAHSPVNLLVTDSFGKQTGIVPIDGLSGLYYTKEEIPGSDVEVLDDEKYVYLPNTGETFSVMAAGYENGSATIGIGQIDAEGNSTTTTSFEIPVSATSSMSFMIQKDIVTTSSTSNALPSSLINTSSNHGVAGQFAVTPLLKATEGTLTLENFGARINDEVTYLKLVIKLLLLKIQLAKLLHHSV